MDHFRSLERCTGTNVSRRSYAQSINLYARHESDDVVRSRFLPSACDPRTAHPRTFGGEVSAVWRWHYWSTLTSVWSGFERLLAMLQTRASGAPQVKPL